MTVRHLINAINVLIVTVIFFMFLIMKNVVNIADRRWIGVRLMPDADRCICCGEIIPEGRMICPQCEGGTEKGWGAS